MRIQNLCRIRIRAQYRYPIFQINSSNFAMIGHRNI